MDAKAAAAKDSTNDEDTLFQKLKPNYGPVADNNMHPPPEVPDQSKFGVPPKDEGKAALDSEEERSVAGRKTMKLPKEKESEEDNEELKVKEEMNAILKRSPSMCASFQYLAPRMCGIRLLTKLLLKL
jgi:hypothetical protein